MGYWIVFLHFGLKDNAGCLFIQILWYKIYLNTQLTQGSQLTITFALKCSYGVIVTKRALANIFYPLTKCGLGCLLGFHTAA